MAEEEEKEEEERQREREIHTRAHFDKVGWIGNKLTHGASKQTACKIQ